MTMQETKDAILAMLGAANGLATRPYGPHRSALDEYMAPGNYSNAESVEREPDGAKFNWVAYSSYGKQDSVPTEDLKAQLERVLADNKLCQNLHATIYQNKDAMAHRVEYRFHTFGVELSESPNGPDFCPSCGWNTQHLKCNAGHDHHPSEVCHYLCANCAANTGITTPCLRRIKVNQEIKSEAFLTRSPNIVSAVSADVKNAVGEILMGYALAENNLRAMMESLPGHKSSNRLSDDIKRLKRYTAEIVEWASTESSDHAQAMNDCITAIISAYEKTTNRRNALAHGQLVQVGFTSFTIGGDNTDRENNQGPRLQIEHGSETVELTGDGIQELLDDTRGFQAHIGRLGEIAESLASP